MKFHFLNNEEFFICTIQIFYCIIRRNLRNWWMNSSENTAQLELRRSLKQGEINQPKLTLFLFTDNIVFTLCQGRDSSGLSTLKKLIRLRD